MGFLIGFVKIEGLQSRVAKKVGHKPHLFFGAFVVNAHKLQSWRVLLHAPSEIYDENNLLLPLVLSML